MPAYPTLSCGGKERYMPAHPNCTMAGQERRGPVAQLGLERPSYMSIRLRSGVFWASGRSWVQNQLFSGKSWSKKELPCALLGQLPVKWKVVGVSETTSFWLQPLLERGWW